MIPIVAIVGRPNVGKSTLFNRLIGKKYAITSKIAGTTRDRIYQKLMVNDREVMLADTGGLDFIKREGIEEDVQVQAKTAINEADIVLFVVDVRSKNNPLDYSVAEILRKSDKPTILVVNKCDSADLEDDIYDFYEFGMGDPIPVSAFHNLGIDRLLSLIDDHLTEMKIDTTKKEQEIDEQYINICFLGRPNVGKSSLVNSFLKEERLIVSDIPGTTRDTTDTLMEYEGKKFNLIDTAGIRRRGRVEKGVEKYSVLRSMQAILRSDIALLIIDYNEGLANQDLHVAQYVLDKYKGLIIVVNKCDLMKDPETEKEKFLNLMRRKMPFVPWAAFIFVSAMNRKNIFKILDLATDIKKERQLKVKEVELNDFIEYVVTRKPPLSTKKNKPKIHSVKQIDIEPPTFEFKVSQRDSIHFSYRRFIENEIRKKYEFYGTPIRMIWENRHAAKRSVKKKAKK